MLHNTVKKAKQPKKEIDRHAPTIPEPRTKGQKGTNARGNVYTCYSVWKVRSQTSEAKVAASHDSGKRTSPTTP